MRFSTLTLGLAFVTASFAQIGEINVNSGPPAEETAPPPLDRSALWIASKTRVTFLLTDPRGRRTGYDPSSNQTFEEIPGSKCELDFVANRYTGEEHSEAYERIAIEPAPQGVYGVRVHGLQDGPFEINITAQSRDGSSEPSKQLEGLVSERDTKFFRLTYDPAPNAQLSVVEKAGPHAPAR